MLPSELPRLATDLQVRVFPGVWKLLSFWGGWCTRMTQRDGMGREVGGGVQDGEQMYTRGGFMLMENQYNIVK